MFSILIFAPISVARANIDAQTAFNGRVENYKKKFPNILSDEEKTFITQNCETTKDKIIKVRDSVNATTLNREDNYGDIERRLSAIQSRFSKQGIDTSSIDLMLASYRIEVSNYKKFADEYQVILNDLVAIDCKLDPMGYKSALLSARSSRELVKTSLEKIKSVYNSQVASGFNLLAKQLYER